MIHVTGTGRSTTTTNMLSWFKKPKPSFESILAALADDIANREIALQELALARQRTTLLFTSYASMIYILYALCWYLGWLASVDELQEMIKAALLLVIPVFIHMVRQFIGRLYDRKQHRQESQLKTLRAQQKEQVDKIKKQTKYDETRSLLEKYTDEPPSTPLGTPIQQRRIVGPRHSAAPLLQTPSRGSPRGAVPNQAANVAGGRGWVDRFAEVLLGDDEQSPASKYALICSNCHAHNGLVLKEELSTTQYHCPKCGHFNPAKSLALLQEPKPKSGMSSSVSTPNLQIRDLRPLEASHLRYNAADSLMEDASVDEIDEETPSQLIPSPPATSREQVRRRKSTQATVEEESD